MPWSSVISAALCLSAALVFALPSQRKHLKRRFRRGSQLIAVLVVGSIVLAMVNLLVASGPWQSEPLREMAIQVTLVFAFGMAIFAITNQIVPVVPQSRQRVVLAIGAHPDDLEIACGATLAKLADTGHEVHVLVMSNGAVGGDEAVRENEAMRGARFMGAKSVVTHSLPDTKLSDSTNEMVQAIEERVTVLNPDLIFTHSEHDQHQDHHAVHFATLRAARRHSSILCFESPSVTRKFNPAVFIDVADYIGVKVHAVAQHADQKGKPYMTEENLKGIAAFRGNQAKTKYAEGFEPVRLLGSAIGVF
ncbi:LmbE family N-acetylglucosaminyl deacetylase [Arthrobacter sp. AG1021]|uniref:PIG-L deacetylase family protein n=1 Tax=Arthrobacter sp. AG1021 TaxID=2183908 RepID=UPI000EAC6645|nr:PIG-L deacetylase family protein [Arthrobacter sp. AG1021]RKS20763.1 LmbE family N-acetylglucosaminyl deacetylase [Arthrobacter sp. AG1021]